MERLFGAHQGRDITHRAYIHLAARQERDSTVKIDGEAALDPAEDHTIYPLAVFRGFFKFFPGLFAARTLAAEDGFAAPVFDALDENFHFIADFELSRLTRQRELF